MWRWVTISRFSPLSYFWKQKMQRAEENPPGKVGWELGACGINFLLSGLAAEEATLASLTEWWTQNEDVSQDIRHPLVLPYPTMQLMGVRARENGRFLAWGPTPSGFRHGDGKNSYSIGGQGWQIPH